MKTISLYGAFCMMSFLVVIYEGCLQSDHISCKIFNSIQLYAYDITHDNNIELGDSSEVFARKLAFKIKYVFDDTMCVAKNSSNIIQSAHATSFNGSDNIFINEKIIDIKIYCTTNFLPNYPTGSILNNLFNIPAFEELQNMERDNTIFPALTVNLDNVPEQTRYYKFYVQLQTNKRIMTDTLPVLKLVL